jgi:hypothetical protein
MGFFQRWWAFFSPEKGWRDRYLAFRSGKNVWEVPGKPECPKVVPFPVQWIPHRLELLPEDDEAAHVRGFVFTQPVCSATGKTVPLGRGVNCLRCGVALHEARAHMVTSFSPPYCSRCRWPILLVSKASI